MRLLRPQTRSKLFALATLVRGFALLPLVLLLLAAQFASGVHHHDGGAHAESCPACVHANTPAIGADDAPSAFAPSLSIERPRFLAAVAAVSPAPRLTASRGPPLA